MSKKTTTAVLSDATLTASGNSGSIETEGADAIVVVVDVSGTPTGTSPSLTFSASYVDPNTGAAYPLTPTSGSFAAITAALASPQRVVFDPLYDGAIEISWAVSGTTPSFGGVSVSLVSVERSSTLE